LFAAIPNSRAGWQSRDKSFIYLVALRGASCPALRTAVHRQVVRGAIRDEAGFAVAARFSSSNSLECDGVQDCWFLPALYHITFRFPGGRLLAGRHWKSSAGAFVTDRNGYGHG